LRLILLLLMLVSNTAFSASSDTGIISELYIDDSKNMAIKFIDGFPTAIKNNECTTGYSWAGVTADVPEIKSSLLAAKLSGSKVTITMYDCTKNGAWLNIRAVIIK